MRQHSECTRAYPFFLVLVCLSTVLSAQPDTLGSKIAAFKTRIAEPLQKALDAGLPGIDQAIRAKALCEASLVYLGAEPRDKSASSMVRACSLSVEAGLLDIKVALLRIKVDSLQTANNKILSELASVHDSILSIQQNQALKLKADLEEQQRATQKLKDDADRKFSELQSALIQVNRDARGTIISMSDILFEIGKADLTVDLQTSLAKIAGILTVFKESHIVVEGHTDIQGAESYNMELSQARAENVMNFLIEQGVDVSRLTAQGFGFTRPIADNETKEGRQKNRRVDLVIQDAQ